MDAATCDLWWYRLSQTVAGKGYCFIQDFVTTEIKTCLPWCLLKPHLFITPQIWSMLPTLNIYQKAVSNHFLPPLSKTNCLLYSLSNTNCPEVIFSSTCLNKGLLTQLHQQKVCRNRVFSQYSQNSGWMSNAASVTADAITPIHFVCQELFNVHFGVHKFCYCNCRLRWGKCLFFHFWQIRDIWKNCH